MHKSLEKEAAFNEETIQPYDVDSYRTEFLKQILSHPGADIAMTALQKKQHQFENSGRTKIGRNDACPCGAVKADGFTRKKFKKCCLN